MDLEKRKYFDEDEIRQFFSAIENRKPTTPQKKRDKKMDLLIFRLALNYGLRTTEAVKLLWADINEKEKQIFVRRLKRKGNPGRWYDIPDDVMGLYLEWKKLRNKSPELSHNPYLFVSQMGRKGRGTNAHLSHDQLYRRFKKYLELAGLPATFHPHALRHTCGVLLAGQGFNAFDIQRRLGHASLTSTMVYVDLKGKEALERNKAMSEALRI
jgi:integrase